MHTSLRCSLCGLAHDIDKPQNLCTSCAKPLLAGYDLAALAGRMTPDVVWARHDRSMWRFWDVLPVDRPADAVSLGEGETPLVSLARRGPFAPFERLYVKDEAGNPTGSFKARGMSAAITRAARLGVRSVALPSAGNAAGAAAYYAARAGIACTVFMPADAPRANVVESILAGAKVYLVDGLISDCGRLVQRGCADRGWFDLSTLKEPFRLEGKKTMGYELALDMADVTGSDRPRLPDCIIYPAGGGTGLVGMWKAFDEMQALGWIGSERPRMVLVQAAGCAPMMRAFDRGEEFAEPWAGATTAAAGLRVPSAVGDFLMLRAVRASGGTAIAISDDDLLTGARELAEHQGICACPEGGAAWKAAEQLLRTGFLRPQDSVVVFNTGGSLKYQHVFPSVELPVLNPADPNALRDVA